MPDRSVAGEDTDAGPPCSCRPTRESASLSLLTVYRNIGYDLPITFRFSWVEPACRQLTRETVRYSHLSADIGSSRPARRAGTNPAIAAKTSRTKRAHAKVGRSKGSTP